MSRSFAIRSAILRISLRFLSSSSSDSTTSDATTASARCIHVTAASESSIGVSPSCCWMRSRSDGFADVGGAPFAGARVRLTADRRVLLRLATARRYGSAGGRRQPGAATRGRRRRRMAAVSSRPQRCGPRQRGGRRSRQNGTSMAQLASGAFLHYFARMCDEGTTIGPHMEQCARYETCSRHVPYASMMFVFVVGRRGPATCCTRKTRNRDPEFFCADSLGYASRALTFRDYWLLFLD